MDKKSLVVSKSNMLARSGNNLELIETKVIEYCLSTLYKEDRPTNETLFEIDVELMGEHFGILPCNAYRELKKVFENIMDKKLVFPAGVSGDMIMTTWVSGIHYNDVNNGLKIRFSEDVLPHIGADALRKNFTAYKLEDVANFKNKYSTILYNLCKSYAHDRADWKTEQISLAEFRKLLFISENEYVLWGTLKKTIMKSIKEINENGKLKVELKEKKMGKKVVGLYFIMGAKDVRIL